MAQETPEPVSIPDPRKDGKEGKKLYLWSRSTQGPVGEGAPGSETSPPTTAAAAPKPDPKDFQANFPVQEGATAAQKPTTAWEVVKNIKSEDFTTFAQAPCARDGLLTGIAAGFVVGGLRLVFKGTIGKASNWAVGSFLLGAAGRHEYCQYERLQERIRMKRTVEVYQETMAEKRRKEAAAALEQKKAEEVAKASQKAWYKFW
ncbi:Cytochrome c oxidase assembly protein COX20 [Colletotrichum aenigma]|uniref:Cytochrome c oxidase assembly protein COX20 n=1 Tax=Colletotrichum aenigma TaxID=1215731 RepID=UPI0018726C85|nr:Cytochrome c oxidase assembly protein COX20 [Colletotrichum aenigma]KAF5521354.1 Cytochrome c oxidase assembly protein COX20 [Colletotrichum aenigma]